mgnify:CR=1 FL=1
MSETSRLRVALIEITCVEFSSANKKLMMLQIDQLEAGVMTSSPDVTHLIQQAASNQNNFIRQHLQHVSNSFTLL